MSDAGDALDPQGFAGVPDALQRLWTPHRMVYVGGDAKPADDSTNACPFCVGASPSDDDPQRLIIHRGKLAFVVLNLYPYNPGHLLVCPYRHVPLYVDLTPEETIEIAELTQAALRTIQSVSSPAGFNIGINQGAVAGAGIHAHLHQHVVPRWLGDANFLPVVGQTKALPQLLADTRDLFAANWQQTSLNEGASNA